ncbi:MAG: nitrogen fixation protein FixH [Gammaproteobacteria bacterium]|nr:MAG: nitrogen fixation protein FixH [Gammaproteobacteria bacterium]
MTRPWYREPYVWLIIALPLSAVVGGIFTIYLAVSTDDGLVVDDYYKQGLAINKVLDRDREAKRLGLVAVPFYDPVAHTLVVEISSPQGYEPPPALPLRLMFSTLSGYDQQLQLARRPDGRYATPVAPLRRGKWYVQIEGEGWRLLEKLLVP